MARAVVDTSAVVGYLERGEKTLKDAMEMFSEVIIPLEVVFETVYVLEGMYGRERVEIFSWLTSLLDHPKLVYDRQVILNTLFRYRDRKNLSVVDCYVLELASEGKCELVTVDEKMMKAFAAR